MIPVEAKLERAAFARSPSSAPSAGVYPAAEAALPPAIGWILRIGTAGCFIGHGAFGVITKAAWVPYFAVAGIGEPMAWRLMPVVGVMDIVIGCLALAWPCRAVFGWAAVWAIWTALLRPLSGESGWETLERAGNYGIPLAMLALVGLRGAWLHRIDQPRSLTDTIRTRVAWTLRLTTAVLLAGHAGCGLLVQKSMFAAHYAVFGGSAALTPWIGGFEFLLAAAVLVLPTPALLIGVCAWKLATEALFPLSGAPLWELIERFGSYTAPLALALLLFNHRPSRMNRPLVPAT